MRFPLALLAALALMRCATAMHHELQQVPVTSTPSGAEVRLDCGRGSSTIGRTPMTLTLRRRDSGCSVTLSKSGWQDARVTFHRLPSPTALTNAVPALLAGGIVANSRVNVAANNDLGAGNTVVSAAASGSGSVSPAAVSGFVFSTAILVDIGSGAMFQQSPARVDVTLQPKC